VGRPTFVRVTEGRKNGGWEGKKKEAAEGKEGGGALKRKKKNNWVVRDLMWVGIIMVGGE